MLVWLPYLILPGILAGCLLFFYLFVRHYIERDKIYFGTLVCCSALLVAASFSLLIVPLDVYAVSADPATTTGLSALKNLINFGYYGSYFVIILSLIITLPFCYFYYEAYTDYATQRGKRISQALKYTAFFILGFAVMVGVAFILKALRTTKAEEDWQRRILGELTNWEAFVIFLVSILSVAGLVVYVPYLSYGLSVLPIFLIKGRRNPITSERELLLAQEEELKVAHSTQTRVAQERHTKNQSINGPNSTLSKMAEKYNYKNKDGSSGDFVRKDHKLRETERKMEENKNKQAALQNENAYWTKCWNCLGPIRIVLGLIFLGLSLLLVTQQIMSVTERIVNSKCGWKCGFTPDKDADQQKYIPNPFDFLFRLIAPAFPIDLILFAVFLCYLGICIVYSVTQLGVRILTWKFSSISPQNTPSNALVLAVAFIAFAMMSMNSQIILSIPGYTAFGKQTYLKTPEPAPEPTPKPDPEQLSKHFFVNNAAQLPSTNVLASKLSSAFTQQLDSAGVEAAAFEPTPIETIPQPVVTKDDKDDKDDKEKRIPCEFQYAELNGQCRMTAFARFMQKANHFLPIFPTIQLVATFVFVIFFFIFFVYALCKKPEVDKVYQSDDPDAPNYIAAY